jgi:hypothetical protein
MTNPVTSLKEWKTYRAELRAALTALQLVPLRAGLRADAWTPRQVLHHVLLVDASSADLLERLVSKAGAVSERDPGDPWPFHAELMDFPLDTAFSVPAFRGTEPKLDVSDRVLRDLEASTLRRHVSLAEHADRFRLEGVVFPHPLAGKLNFYEWLVFGGIHESLHLTQLKRDVGRDSL